MKKFDEFIGENKSYFTSLKEPLKKILLKEHGVAISEVYIYQIGDYKSKEYHAIVVKLTKKSVQDIRRVPSFETGIEEAENLKKFFTGLLEFGKKYGAYYQKLNETALSTEFEIEFRFDEQEFLENSYLRSMIGINKFGM